MNQEIFKNQSLGSIEMSEKDKFLHELAEFYHESTEEYDRSICTGKNKYGEAVPITNDERRLINRNAIAVRQICINRGREKDISKDDAIKAIQKFH